MKDLSKDIYSSTAVLIELLPEIEKLEKDSWFSEISEMIFRFLENENEMVKKVKKASPEWKASPEYHPNF